MCQSDEDPAVTEVPAAAEPSAGKSLEFSFFLCFHLLLLDNLHKD